VWRDEWVFLQYTALAWSQRGFPLQILRVVGSLRDAGSRVAIVYHDVEAYVGSRMIDKVRRSAQLRTMRRALRISDLAVFTVPLEKVSWVSAAPKNAVFIPVGANLTSSAVLHLDSSSVGAVKTIAVFGITGGDAGRSEMEMIVEAVRFAAKQIGRLRLVVLGRNSESADTELRAALRHAPVAIEVLGVIPAEEVARALCSADVLLFVRGSISTRRGSAIAGIACGLPVRKQLRQLLMPAWCSWIEKSRSRSARRLFVYSAMTNIARRSAREATMRRHDIFRGKRLLLVTQRS
jgi:hypothetical protein